MEKLLKSVPNTDLTESIVLLCNKKNINTVSEFLQIDSIKLCWMTNLQRKQVMNIKKLLQREYCETLIDNSYGQLFNIYKIIPTGIKNLDEILDGGIMIGNLIEVCGYSAMGKTLLSITTAINLANMYKFESLYIDLKHNLYGSRLFKILKNRNIKYNDIYNIMNKIYVKRFSNAKDLIKFLNEFLQNIDMYKNCKLIIIDSIPSVWLLYAGYETNEGIILLSELTTLLRKLINVHYKIIIVVNILTRWLKTDLDENYLKTSQTKIKPSLGKYWETVPTLRLSIGKNLIYMPPKIDKMNTVDINEDHKNNVVLKTNQCKLNNNIILNYNQRFIEILHSNFYKIGEYCVVDINDMGII